MSRQVLEYGAIFSAIALYGWIQPSLSESSTHNCDVPSSVSQTESHCEPEAHKNISTAPERLLTQWSDRQSDELPDRMEVFYGNLLEHAQAAANRDQFTEAVTQVAGIPQNSRHHKLAQQLQDDWSQELMRQATSEFQQAHVAKAISILDAIPPTTQWHERAIALRQRWSQQAALLDRAIAAKESGDWQGAINAIKSLEASPMYHSLPIQQLLQQAMTKLYEPDQTLLQIATGDLPTIKPPIAPPESIPVM